MIDAIDEGSNAVAAAAEEQAAVVAEIGRNARDAADLTSRVDQGIRTVADSAATSTTSANTVLEATRDLDGQMIEVTQAVQAFLTEVRRI